MHRANHPDSEHYCESVWKVDPVKACKGRPVALAWFSPDCKHFSKAKGGKPVEKKIRGLAWIVLKWAALVRPRVIMLENVEEFVTWGPIRKGKPIKSKKGQTFQQWKGQLQALGYKIEHRELIACDYGAPTTRKRFFLVARCDGKPIVWPKPTHGNPDCIEVRCGLLEPWRTAAECIDWSLPCPSIFERKKPLAENTMRRIARGIQKFVLENPRPFIVRNAFTTSGSPAEKSIDKPISTIVSKPEHWLVTPVISQIGQTGGGDRLHGIDDPLSTIVSKAEHLLVAPALMQYHGETGESRARGQGMEEPIMTVDAANRYGLVSAFISKYFAGGYTGAGSGVDNPVPTVTAIDHNAIVTSHLLQLNNHCDGRNMNAPVPTIVAGPGHWGEVRTFLMTYYGNGEDIGQKVDEPLRTVTSKDRFGIVTVAGQEYQIVDIGMRMLEPHELFKAQGFPDDYIIDRDADGKPYPKTAQVARCGNAVPPPFAEALTRANLPELCQVPREQAS